MGKDYYKILDVSRDAGEDQIKKSYRKLALKWHPDRNMENKKQAEEQFKLISEAYEVLSDKQKRSIYDQFGEEGLKAGSGMPPPGATGKPGEGFFPGGGSFFFTSGGPGGGGGRTGRHPFQPTRAEDIFKQFFGGANPFEQMGNAGPFGNYMDMDDFMGRPESTAQFQSQKQHPQRPDQPIPPAVIPLEATLEELYTGTSKKLKITRQRFTPGPTSARPIATSTSTLIKVDIKPGWKSGTKIKFANEGDEVSPGRFQDLEFLLKERPHETFKREGDNLIIHVTIPLVNALTGYSKKITLLDGKKILISNEQVTKPGHVEKVVGRGMPKQKNPSQMGDLLVKFDIEFPDSLSKEKQEQLKKIL